METDQYKELQSQLLARYRLEQKLLRATEFTKSKTASPNATTPALISTLTPTKKQNNSVSKETNK